MARATSANEQCLSVTSKIFSERYASQRFKFSNKDPDAFAILKYFGSSIQPTKFYFGHEHNCNSNKTSEYRQILQYADRNRKSVEEFEVMGELCGINVFHEIKNPFEKVEIAIINQWTLAMEKGDERNLCAIFPNVRHLELSFGNLTDQAFLDCEFHLLDELTIGGDILDETYDETLKKLLIKNSRIQHIVFTTAMNRRVFQLLNKYLRNLKHVSVSGRVLDDDVEDEIFMPSVRKLEINFKAWSECQIPIGISFGGGELQELDIQCYSDERKFEYFSTLYRYPNIKTLSAGVKLNNRDLLKMVGRFPLLTKANLSVVSDVTSDSIVKFIENCKQLKDINFFFSGSGPKSTMESELKEKISDSFSITLKWTNDLLRLERNESNSIFITSGLVSFFIAMHICRAFFP